MATLATQLPYNHPMSDFQSGYLYKRLQEVFGGPVEFEIEYDIRAKKVCYHLTKDGRHYHLNLTEDFLEERIRSVPDPRIIMDLILEQLARCVRQEEMKQYPTKLVVRKGVHPDDKIEVDLTDRPLAHLNTERLFLEYERALENEEADKKRRRELRRDLRVLRFDEKTIRADIKT